MSDVLRVALSKQVVVFPKNIFASFLWKVGQDAAGAREKPCSDLF